MSEFSKYLNEQLRVFFKCETTAHSLSFMPQFPLQKPTPLENFCTPHRPFVPNLPIRKVYPSPSFSQFRLKGTSYMQAFQ